ncbi:MAG: recombinase family protein [Dehalococcoidia bacterium]|nr:recombinase family protein [Dehalococcoidia bacterium]
MAVKETETVTEEELNQYIAAAAKAASYEKGFGITGCDLSMPIWWAGYCRQSLDQQSHNNRLPEYLLTLARMAKEQGVAIPREYILYDHVSGEHLDRPRMQFLRHELVDKKKVLGIFFADLRCLSREPAPQQVFEREAEIRGVKLMFDDAPSGMDVGSQFARSAITFSNKLMRLATHGNARAGNIGRVLKGSVPACKAAYGYRYCRDAELTSAGKVHIKKAWWEIDRMSDDITSAKDSPAWIVQQVFHWIGEEGLTAWRVARKLNEMEVHSPRGEKWGPNSVCKLVRRACYTGKNAYNSKSMVPNPARPLGDVTGQVKRTILREKPKEEWVFFNVPQIVPDELWQKANTALTVRGRGRGKEGQAIQALLRSRIFCPRCGLPMVVRRDGHDRKVYYHCVRRYRVWDGNACDFRKFISARWDDVVWDCVYALLNDPSWLEEQLTAEKDHRDVATKLIDAEQKKISQLQAKITKVQTGYEEGIYSAEEARNRINVCHHVVTLAQAEITRLEHQAGSPTTSSVIGDFKRELDSLRKANLDEASFEDRLQLLRLLNIRVYPSEDLKTVRIKTGLDVDSNYTEAGGSQDHCGKVIFEPPKGTIPRTRRKSKDWSGRVFSITFSWPFQKCRSTEKQ